MCMLHAHVHVSPHQPGCKKGRSCRHFGFGMALFIFAVATAALRMQAFALGALERPPLPRVAASMLEQGLERPTAALVPPPRRLTDLLELEAKGVPQKQGSLFTGRTRRVVRRGMNACASNPGPQNTSFAATGKPAVCG